MGNNAFDRFRVVDLLDAPEVLDCSITAIPGSGSSPLEVVHSLAREAHQVAIRDGIQSEFIGLYAGQTGQEVLKAIIGGPGPNYEYIHLAAGERISLRSMGTNAIVSGQLVLEFVGSA